MVAKALLREKIKERLDALEVLMNSQTHMDEERYTEVIVALDSVEKFWSVLQEDEKEFIGAIHYACNNQVRWD